MRSRDRRQEDNAHILGKGKPACKLSVCVLTIVAVHPLLCALPLSLSLSLSLCLSVPLSLCRLSLAPASIFMLTRALCQIRHHSSSSPNDCASLHTTSPARACATNRTAASMQCKTGAERRGGKCRGKQRMRCCSKKRLSCLHGFVRECVQ